MGNGFIGSNLLKSLQKYYQVCALSSMEKQPYTADNDRQLAEIGQFGFAFPEQGIEKVVAKKYVDDFEFKNMVDKFIFV